MPGPGRHPASRVLLLLTIVTIQFALFEAAPHVGSLEADPLSSRCSTGDLGYRLLPGARTRFTTPEFDTTLAIDNSGVRTTRRSARRALFGSTSSRTVMKASTGAAEQQL